ncbi:hypothetical protein QQM79_15370 [Marinobacteraceae bacterium S3BR75-40.1]
MPQIQFATKLCSPRDLVGDDTDALMAFSRTNNVAMGRLLQPGEAYSLDFEDPQALGVVRKINALPAEERRSLARSTELMGDELHGLYGFFAANLTAEKMQTINSLIGASTTAGDTRLNTFQKALLKYQNALLDLRKVHESNGSGGQRFRAETAVRRAFQSLRATFATELSRFAPVSLRNKNRGDALSNAERGITLASRAPGAKPDQRLFVADTTQASRLGGFARFLGWLGTIGVVVDAGFRANHVCETYDGGGQWMRESAVQMTGFGAGGAVGGWVGRAVITGGAAYAAEAGLIVAGPMGWIALGVIVSVGVLAGYAAGTQMDEIGQYIASKVWDWN